MKIIKLSDPLNKTGKSYHLHFFDDNATPSYIKTLLKSQGFKIESIENVTIQFATLQINGLTIELQSLIQQTQATTIENLILYVIETKNANEYGCRLMDLCKDKDICIFNLEKSKSCEDGKKIKKAYYTDFIDSYGYSELICILEDDAEKIFHFHAGNPMPKIPYILDHSFDYVIGLCTGLSTMMIDATENCESHHFILKKGE